MSDRLALIIANSEFDDPRLTRLATPSRDAEALTQVLGDPAIGSFEVTLLANKTLRVVRREIARLYQRKKRGDLLLLYYSGHGIKDDYGDLYLAVKDTETDVVSATAINAAFVRDRLDKSSSQRKVVVLDCCHSGAFARGAKVALGSSAGTLEAFEGSGYGRVILTASNAVEYAWEGDKLLGEATRSVFTHFLVQGLQTGAADLNGDGKISLKELYDYTYEQVLTSGLSKQTPQMSAPKVEGQIIIAQNPRPVVKPAELPSELRQAIESSLAWMREGAASGLEWLLRGSDKRLALAAREALTRLADDDSRQVSARATRALTVSPVAVLAKPPPPPPPPLPPLVVVNKIEEPVSPVPPQGEGVEEGKALTDRERRAIEERGEDVIMPLISLRMRTLVKEEAEEMGKGLEKLQEQMIRLEDGISTMSDEEWKQVLQDAIKSAESLMEAKAVARKGEEKIAQALRNWIGLAQTTVKRSNAQ
jgi:hypothetical protein